MKLVGISMVRNEADILELFIRHNLAYLDHMLVLDHGSTDETAPLLRALAAEGMPLTLLSHKGLAFDQARITTDMLQIAFQKFGADSVFPLDADEFIRCASRLHLEALLQAHSDHQALAISWPVYVSAEGSEAEADPLRRHCWRVSTAKPSLPKVVVQRSITARSQFALMPGNHAVLVPAGNGAARKLKDVQIPFDDLALAHLPFRSADQLMAKVLVGWLNSRLHYRDRPEMHRLGWHWRSLFERIRQKGPITPSEVRSAAVCLYALDRDWDGEDPLADYSLIHDPLPVLATTHLPAGRPDALQLLTQWASSLVDRMIAPEEQSQRS
jgi:hypothetical protein